MWTIKYPGSIRVLYRDPRNAEKPLSVSCISKQTYAIRRWQHFVIVKKGSDLRIYVDATLAAATKVSSTFEGNLHLLVGQQSPKQRRNPFIGQLDELAVYKRALSEKEIGNHFRAVKWKTSGSQQPVNEI
jgi:hypothetical protein